MDNKMLLGRIEEKSIVVITGGGDAGLYLYRMLRKEAAEKSIFLCDNSHKKQGRYREYEVYPVEEMARRYQDGIFLLTSSIHENMMRDQLIALGIKEKNIILAVTEETEIFLNEQQRKKKLTPKQKLQFEVDIASHCNLNCKCCSQFSCIADEEFIDVDQMRRDFERLGTLFDRECERIYLIGGEPLLHPRLPECMEIARNAFPVGKISVFTNGILLGSCNEDFWRVCRDNRITIIVTKYPIVLDYEKISQKAIEENVTFEFFGASEDFKFMTNMGLDLSGNQLPEESFACCIEANNCIKLSNGRLYTCTRPAAIYKFNNYFKKNLTVSEQDFIDIYQTGSAEEILMSLARPIPFCRYCNQDRGVKHAMSWGQTEKRIEEWL